MTNAKQARQMLSGWGNYPSAFCHTRRPEKYGDLKTLPEHCLARGQGRSYGDAALNKDHVVLLTERLNRILHFDKIKGILTAEAGITLKEILEVIVPAGWFLPVTPGTQYASLGGCVAADAHGKNHHHEGTMGQHVIALELITADHNTYLCTPQKYTDLFWATIGGMGLTGIIGTVVLKLKSITSPYMQVRHHATTNLEQTLAVFADSSLDDQYTVAWIDTLAHGKHKGRGIMMAAHHANEEEIVHYKTKKTKQMTEKIWTFPFSLPGWLLNPTFLRGFNTLYYHRESKKKVPFLQHYRPFFYPLDKIQYWNRLYGKKGFIQYQCVIPTSNAFMGIQQILSTLSQYGCPSFLGVLKKFGEHNKSYLSFPRSGYTLALDIPFRGKETLRTIERLDDIVCTLEGRIYLAKDACLSPEHFRQMYPFYSEWLNVKKHFDPENLFTSSLARRLAIGTAL